MRCHVLHQRHAGLASAAARMSGAGVSMQVELAGQQRVWCAVATSGAQTSTIAVRLGHAAPGSGRRCCLHQLGRGARHQLGQLERARCPEGSKANLLQLRPSFSYCAGRQMRNHSIW
jgi:hypothetical protein